jgi:hypothetical protein
MKYWLLIISLFILGCSGEESGSAEETANATSTQLWKHRKRPTRTKKGASHLKSDLR